MAGYLGVPLEMHWILENALVYVIVYVVVALNLLPSLIAVVLLAVALNGSPAS